MSLLEEELGREMVFVSGLAVTPELTQENFFLGGEGGTNGILGEMLTQS